MMTLQQPKTRTEKTQDLISKLIHQYGGPASNAFFDEGFNIFTSPTVEGIIGYRVVSDCAIVYGDPLCSQDNLTTLTSEFEQFCKQHKYPLIYLITSQNFSKWALENGRAHAKIEVGEELFLVPSELPKQGHNARTLRNKVKHAQKEGLTFHEYHDNDPDMEKAIEKASHEWLKGRSGPQIYLSHVHLFEDKASGRWFYVKQNDNIAGVLFLNKLGSKNGWLLDRLMPLPDAPGGTSEMLVIETLQQLEKEGCQYISFGIATGDHLGEIVGLGKCSTWLARNVFRAANRAFHLDNRKKYWSKYDPQSTPVSALFKDPHVKLKTVFALSKALNVSL